MVLRLNVLSGSGEGLNLVSLPDVMLFQRKSINAEYDNKPTSILAESSDYGVTTSIG